MNQNKIDVKEMKMLSYQKRQAFRIKLRLLYSLGQFKFNTKASLYLLSIKMHQILRTGNIQPHTITLKNERPLLNMSRQKKFKWFSGVVCQS